MKKIILVFSLMLIIFTTTNCKNEKVKEPMPMGDFNIKVEEIEKNNKDSLHSEGPTFIENKKEAVPPTAEFSKGEVGPSHEERNEDLPIAEFDEFAEHDVPINITEIK